MTCTLVLRVFFGILNPNYSEDDSRASDIQSPVAVTRGGGGGGGNHHI